MTLINKIQAEVDGVLEKIDENQLEEAARLIQPQTPLFADGEGRSGLQAKGFAMRLMHVGFKPWVIGETVTPSLRKGDVYLGVSGSGKTPGTVANARRAKEMGLKVIAVTSKADSPLAECADAVIIIPGRVKQDSAAGSIQLLSSLFDQCTHIALDALCLMLSRRDNVSDADANANHANVE